MTPTSIQEAIARLRYLLETFEPGTMLDRYEVDAIEALLASHDKLIRSLTKTGVNLAAAVSLLEGGGKKAAGSDKIFAQMLVDYNTALDRARATLKEITG
jgi:hypothetical protein